MWASQWGDTGLIRTAANGHHDVVGLLLDRGADVEAKNNVSGLLPCIRRNNVLLLPAGSRHSRPVDATCVDYNVAPGPRGRAIGGCGVGDDRQCLLWGLQVREYPATGMRCDCLGVSSFGYCRMAELR